MFEFPKELWYKIKQYEYQMLQYNVMSETMKDLLFHAYMPYSLSMHQYKGKEKLYEQMEKTKYIWNPYINNEIMMKLCSKYSSKAFNDCS
jgi:hypothetical protein